MKSIIRKYLKGESTTNEQFELLEWIRKDEHLNEFQQIKEGWKTEISEESVPKKLANDWHKIQVQMMESLQEEVQRKQRTLNFFRYAAIFMILIAIPAFLYVINSANKNNTLFTTTVAADYGQISKVQLPDSTVVWVNSGSVIRYNNQFSAGNRNIELVGEAFFKVHKNKKLPLIVSNGDLQVKVLGTEFLISAYPEETNIQVVLEKGKVELNSATNQDFRQEMVPGEMVSYNKSTKLTDVDNVNTNLYTSWKDGIINIYNLPLSELVIRLEKRYNQKFKVEDAIKNMPFTFTIKNEDLSNILGLIEKITPIEAIQHENYIELRLKNNRRSGMK